MHYLIAVFPADNHQSGASEELLVGYCSESLGCGQKIVRFDAKLQLTVATLAMLMWLSGNTYRIR